MATRVDWRGHGPNNAKRALERYPNVPTERFRESLARVSAIIVFQLCFSIYSEEKDLPMLMKVFSEVHEKWVQIGSLVNTSLSSEALKRKHGSKPISKY